MTAFTNAQLLEVIAYQTEIASTRMDVDAVITRTAERAQALLQGDGAVVELAEDTELVYRAATGIALPQLGLRVPREGSLSGLCLASGEAMVCTDAASDPRVHRATVEAVGLRAMVIVPLRHGERCVGVLKVLSRTPRRFDGASASLLALLTGVIGAAISHATEHDRHLARTEALYQLATRDALTGLANRALFFDRGRQALAAARRRGQPMGLLLLDMDGLKPLNDTLGHGAGDAALRTLGTRLATHTRASDLAARLGGDEFAVLLTVLAKEEDAEGARRHLQAAGEGAFVHEGRSLDLRVSAGLASYPRDGETLEALLEAADERMYVQKQGRGAARV